MMIVEKENEVIQLVREIGIMRYLAWCVGGETVLMFFLTHSAVYGYANGMTAQEQLKLIAAFFAVGMLLSISSRSIGNVFAAVVFPPAAYLVFIYAADYQSLILGALIGSLVLFLIMNSIAYDFTGHLLKSILRARFSATICLLTAVMLIICDVYGIETPINTVPVVSIGTSVAEPDEPVETSDTEEPEITIPDSQWTFENQTETLKILSPENWETAGIDNKLNAMQCLANIYAHEFQSNQLDLIGEEMESNEIYTRAGYYSHDNKTIYMNTTVLETCDAETAIDTVSHEFYHSIQNYLIEEYYAADERTRKQDKFAHVEEYIEELEHYIDASEGYDAYYSQQLEIDARDFAESEVQHTFAKLAEINGH